MAEFIDKNNGLKKQIEASKERAKLQRLEPSELQKAVIKCAEYLESVNKSN